MKFRPTYYEAGPSEESTLTVIIYVASASLLAYLAYLVSTISPVAPIQSAASFACVCVGLIGMIWAIELVNRAILWNETRGYTDE